METSLEHVFDYEGSKVRTVVINGEPWFVAKDVCEVLGHSDVSMAVRRLDEDERLIQALFVSGQNRDMMLVSESGLYSLVLTSRKPEAKAFKRWITHEVIPAIRKDGMYVTPEMLFNPEHLLRVTERLVQEHRARLAAEEQLRLQAPKVELYDILLSAKNAQTMNEVAKAFGYGRNRLFAFLRDRGVLMRNNLPYQRFLDGGYFEVREVSTQRGEFYVNVTQTLVTPKGMDFIGRLLKGQLQEALN